MEINIPELRLTSVWWYFLPCIHYRFVVIFRSSEEQVEQEADDGIDELVPSTGMREAGQEADDDDIDHDVVPTTGNYKVCIFTIKSM